MVSEQRPDGWWGTPWYGFRVVLAVAFATLLVGFINGAIRHGDSPGLTALNGAVGSTEIFWYRVQYEVQAGLVFAGVPSILSVLLRSRPSRVAVIRRLLVGPIVAGTLLSGFSVMWSWTLLGPALGMTVIACAGFVLMGVVFGITKAPPMRPRADQPLPLG